MDSNLLTMPCLYCGIDITELETGYLPDGAVIWGDWFAHEDCIDKDFKEYLEKEKKT